MTYSVFAVDANTLSPSGCAAYTYTLNGFLPYLREPWYQFSEQAVDDVSKNGNTNPAFPFLTGHGGANQVVPFAFLGVRTDQAILYINPSLPPQIPNVKVRTFHFAGATLSASMNSTHTQITRLKTPSSSGLVDFYSNGTLPFAVGAPGEVPSNRTYNIAIRQTITIPNRMYWQIPSQASNLLQCLPVTSSDGYVAGQFPVAANDGASSTSWQPLSNSTSSLLVNMSTVAAAPVSSIFLEWGLRPPTHAVVYLGNDTDSCNNIAGEAIRIDVGAISPNLPYNATASELSSQNVEPVVSNTTTVEVFGGVWSGKYARLEIEGCWEEDGEGATVNEFALIRGTR
jgi:hypothetical protein